MIRASIDLTKGGVIKESDSSGSSQLQPVTKCSCLSSSVTAKLDEVAKGVSSIQKVLISLVPRPPPFLSSICVHNNTRERKIDKIGGRPGSSHHVSGREVNVGGEGPIFKYIRNKLESEFLTSQDE